MHISDIQIGRESFFDFTLAIKGTTIENPQKIVDAPCTISELAGTLQIHVKDKTYAIKCSKPTDESIVQDLIRDRHRALCSISFARINEVSIAARTFFDVITFPEASQIAVSDMIMDDIQNRWKKPDTSKADILIWLNSQCCITTHENGNALLVSQGPSASKSDSAFRLYGKEITLDISRNQAQQWEIQRISSIRKKKPDETFPIKLLRGHFSFLDITVATLAQQEMQAELNAILNSGESYIALWRQYNQLEREKAESNAFDLGKLRYYGCRFDPQNDCYRLQLKDHETKVFDFIAMSADLEMDVELGKDIPYFLRGLSIDDAPPSIGKRTIGKIRSFDEHKMELTWRPGKEDAPPPSDAGFIYGSLLGTEIMLKRREMAAETIRTGTAPLQQISNILENRPVPTRKMRHIDPITPAVNRAFAAPFNPRQREAIEIALNTPDIALIQGPPGTGKTQVISAICIRLVEEAKVRNESPSKMVLLTAFQHDAVFNVADRTRVMGLPAIKVASKGNTNEIVDTWSRQVQEKIDTQLAAWPQSSLRLVKKEVLKALGLYKNGGWDQQSLAARISELYSLTAAWLTPDLLGKIAYLKNYPSHVAYDFEGETLAVIQKAIRSLRTDSIAWSDDGPIRLGILLKRLEEVGSKPVDLPLDWMKELVPAEPTDEDFEKLKELQSQLLDYYQVKNPLDDRGVLPTLEIDTFFASLISTLNEEIANSRDGVQAILEEYLEDLKIDPNAAKEAITAYTSILASTVQGSDSIAMTTVLGPGNEVFNTVIVDEAARANPLDLFIALTKGRVRIILVGDHRQLPHMLEPDLEETLKTNNAALFKTSNLNEAIKQSLFERLFVHLRNQERSDGIRRTITLDEQYRMHPTIGEFVSKTFYERHNEQPIHNRTDANKLEHPFTQYEGKQVVWHNVPLSRGYENKEGSISRRCEAQTAMKVLSTLLDEAPDLSFGLITFYSKQVQELMTQGKAFGITERSADGYLQISGHHAGLTTAGKERLRIGSVDAFQGKEFDVVILSTVRSNDFPLSSDDPTTARRKYGFLTFENRLNVAMSRSKRLLITVGDAAMFKSPAAAEYLPGLYEFYQLTGGPNGKREN